MPLLGLLSTVVILCHGFGVTRAALVNVTVDDSFGDPLTHGQFGFNPNDMWNDQNCEMGGCTFGADIRSAGSGTWHESTFYPVGSAMQPNVTKSASLSFNGTAVYMFCILAHTDDHPSGRAAMQFFIDDAQVGEFMREPTGDTSYDYNVLVYSNTSVNPGQHLFRVDNYGKGNKSLLVIDYVIYSYDNGLAESYATPSPPVTTSLYTSGAVTATPTTTQAPATTTNTSITTASSDTPSVTPLPTPSAPKSNSDVALIAGVSVAATLLLCAVCALLYFHCHYRRLHRQHVHFGRHLDPPEALPTSATHGSLPSAIPPSDLNDTCVTLPSPTSAIHGSLPSATSPCDSINTRATLPPPTYDQIEHDQQLVTHAWPGAAHTVRGDP